MRRRLYVDRPGEVVGLSFLATGNTQIQVRVTAGSKDLPETIAEVEFPGGLRPAEDWAPTLGIAEGAPLIFEGERVVLLLEVDPVQVRSCPRCGPACIAPRQTESCSRSPRTLSRSPSRQDLHRTLSSYSLAFSIPTRRRRELKDWARLPRGQGCLPALRHWEFRESPRCIRHLRRRGLPGRQEWELGRYTRAVATLATRIDHAWNR